MTKWNCIKRGEAKYAKYNFSVEKIILVSDMYIRKKKVREKSRECHNHKPQPFPDTKRKRKPTNPNKRKSNKRTKSTNISSLFPKRVNRNAERTEKFNVHLSTEVLTNIPKYRDMY